jgi:isoleucyl-tRNA synthetase
LSTELTPELVREGLARDLVRLIQERRKDLDCQYTDRIRVGIVTASRELQDAVAENADYLQGETLAVQLGAAALADAEGVQHTVADSEVTIYVTVIAEE